MHFNLNDCFLSIKFNLKVFFSKILPDHKRQLSYDAFNFKCPSVILKKGVVKKKKKKAELTMNPTLRVMFLIPTPARVIRNT